jgi:hypothetical protein
MVDDILRCGLWNLRIEQGRAATLGELLAAGATTQQPDTVGAIDLAHDESGFARGPKQMACRIDTR